jgi:hypothetical protein
MQSVRSNSREDVTEPQSNAHGDVPNLEKFQTILQGDVPKGREGKHKRIVARLLADIARLKPGMALKVPLAVLPDSKENIRSALNRATRMRNLEVATSSDAEFLYVWKAPLENPPAEK